MPIELFIAVKRFISKVEALLFISETQEEQGGRGYQRKVFAWLAVITLLAALLRLYRLGYLGLWYDEACTYFLSDYAARCDRLFNNDYNNDPPLFLLLFRPWRIFCDTFLPFQPGSGGYDFVLRLLPCFFSVLTVPATFLAGRAIFRYLPSRKSIGLSETDSSMEDQAALAAALLVAISPFHIYYAQELRSYSLFTLLGTMILWAFIRSLQGNTRSSWVCLTLFLTLSFWNHFFAAWFFIALDAYLLITFRAHARFYKTWAVCHIIAGLACLPALLIAYQMSQTVGKITVPWIPPPDIKTLCITFKTFFAGYSPRAWAYWCIFLLCSGLCGLGAWSLLRKRLSAFLLLVIWTFLAMGASALLWRLRDFSYYEIRLFIWAAISAALLTGYGWARLKKGLRFLSAAVLLTLTAILLKDAYAHQIHPASQHRLGVRYKAENRTAANYLAAHGSPEEPVYHASHVTLPSFRIYLPDYSQIHVCLGQAEVDGFLSAYPNKPLWQHLDMLPYPQDSLNTDVPSFWLVVSWWEPFEPQPVLEELQRRFNLKYRETYRGDFFALQLVHYEARLETALSK